MVGEGLGAPVECGVGDGVKVGFPGADDSGGDGDGDGDGVCTPLGAGDGVGAVGDGTDDGSGAGGLVSG